MEAKSDYIIIGMYLMYILKKPGGSWLTTEPLAQSQDGQASVDIVLLVLQSGLRHDPDIAVEFCKGRGGTKGGWGASQTERHEQSAVGGP